VPLLLRKVSINNSSELAKAANVDVTKGKYGAEARSTIMNVNTSAAAKSASNTQKGAATVGKVSNVYMGIIMLFPYNILNRRV